MNLGDFAFCFELAEVFLLAVDVVLFDKLLYVEEVGGDLESWGFVYSILGLDLLGDLGDIVTTVTAINDSVELIHFYHVFGEGCGIVSDVLDFRIDFFLKVESEATLRL